MPWPNRRRCPRRDADRLGRRRRLRPARRRHQRHHGGAAQAPGRRSASSRCGTRRRRPSWPAATPSSPGRLGVCLATSGPGGIHLLNGLYDAKLDGQPVLAITGHAVPRPDRHPHQQDVELDSSSWTSPSTSPRHGPGARRERGRARLPHRARLPRRRPHHDPGRHPGPGRPSDDALRSATCRTTSPTCMAAARACAARRRARSAPPTCSTPARRSCILAGRGALGAADELAALAERLGAPIVKPLLGKACVPDDSPYTTGGIGLLGTRPSQEALEGATRC